MRCLAKWSEWPVVMRAPDIQRRRQELGITEETPWPHPKVVAAWYPNAVALADLIMSQRRQVARKRRLTAKIYAAGIAEFQERVIPGFEPDGACDPYRRAIVEDRLEPDTEVEGKSLGVVGIR
jgi:hypothetical protein